MKKALINIDYTNDFVAENGALTCGLPGQNIEQHIYNITEELYKEGADIFFAIDIHQLNDPYHPETKLFPPHNIAGTEGRHLYGSLQGWYDKHQADDRVHWFDKTRYSAFCGTPLLTLLRERGIEELHLVGVCTDICILHTAVEAYNLGFKLVIHEQGVASFNQAGHEWALGHFKDTLGARIV